MDVYVRRLEERKEMQDGWAESRFFLHIFPVKRPGTAGTYHSDGLHRQVSEWNSKDAQFMQFSSNPLASVQWIRFSELHQNFCIISFLAVSSRILAELMHIPVFIHLDRIVFLCQQICFMALGWVDLNSNFIHVKQAKLYKPKSVSKPTRLYRTNLISCRSDHLAPFDGCSLQFNHFRALQYFLYCL